MKLIDENYQPIDFQEEDTVRYYFEYDVTESDFFLKLANEWNLDCYNELLYTLRIGSETVQIPSTRHIMVADVYAETVDWIRADEIMGREITTALYYTSLDADKLSVEKVTVESVSEAPVKTLVPNTKNLIPVATTGNRMVLTSEKDCFVKTKVMNFLCLY